MTPPFQCFFRDVSNKSNVKQSPSAFAGCNSGSKRSALKVIFITTKHSSSFLQTISLSLCLSSTSFDHHFRNLKGTGEPNRQQRTLVWRNNFELFGFKNFFSIPKYIFFARSLAVLYFWLTLN